MYTLLATVFLCRRYVLFIIFICKPPSGFNNSLQNDTVGEKKVNERNREIDNLELALRTRERDALTERVLKGSSLTRINLANLVNLSKTTSSD